MENGLFDDLPPPDVPKNSTPPGGGPEGTRRLGHASNHIESRRCINPAAATLAEVRITPASRRGAPETSRAAAASVAHVTGGRRLAVLEAIAAAGARGLTDDEGEWAIGWNAQAWTPRRNELARLGLVVPTGERRPTASGRSATVWRAADGVVTHA